jgi:hypothetical protein
VRDLLARTIVISSLSLIITILTASNTHALVVDGPCKKVDVIFARGSGVEVGKENTEAPKFFGAIQERIKNGVIGLNIYELGKETYGGHNYEAVNVSDTRNWNALGAVTSAGYANDYGKSVDSGVGELYNYVIQRYEKCKSEGILFILGGYSQGAQVIGQTLAKFSETVRNRIIFAGFFGDPKLHLPEGEGWNPPACQGKDLSVYRRTFVDCDLDNGSLGSRKPYLPMDMKVKSGLWCYKSDYVCGTSKNPLDTSGHGEYKNSGGAIDEAAREAMVKLKARLKAEAPPTPTPQPGQPPTPPPAYEALDIKYVFGTKTTGSNVVFLVDASEQMTTNHQKVQQFINQKGPEILASGGKYTVIPYYGYYGLHPDIVAGIGGSNYYTRALTSPFSTPVHEKYTTPFIYGGVVGDPNSGSGQIHGSAIAALKKTFESLDWQYGSTKSVILLTNNPSNDSNNGVGATMEQVVRLSLSIDPVNVYPVVPEEMANSYQSLAKDTAGQVVTYTDDLLQAANQAFTKTTQRPVPLLKNTEYRAEPGQEITFDASDSYVIDADITKYEWDFDGDSVFEATTTTPSINHTYSADFTGLMQVRISASNNTIANMSATVKVAVTQPPATPASPKNLAYTITSTTDNKSAVMINWEQGDTPVDRWLVRVNDMPMGYVEGTRTSLEITDILRTENVVISVAGATNELQAGNYSDVTIPALVPPEPPITSTCTQGNLFVQYYCKAVALFKIYVGGVWRYILPYQI